MRFTVQTLASGSSGNMALVRLDGAAIVIDIGIASQRGTREALAAAGVAPERLDAVLVSHAHGDHLGWSGLKVAVDAGVPALAGEWTIRAAARLWRAKTGRPLPSSAFHETRPGTTYLVGPFEVTPFPVLHDVPTFGYVISTGGPHPRRLVVATDLGCAPDDLLDPFAGADVAVLEANYDEDLLRASPRNAADRQRVASPLGHLSNVDAGRFLHRLAAHTGRLPRTVVLAHLSEDHNRPSIAIRDVRAAADAGEDSTTMLAAPRRAAGPEIEL